jgi:hypothetical protein
MATCLPMEFGPAEPGVWDALGFTLRPVANWDRFAVLRSEAPGDALAAADAVLAAHPTWKPLDYGGATRAQAIVLRNATNDGQTVNFDTRPKES